MQGLGRELIVSVLGPFGVDIYLDSLSMAVAHMSTSYGHSCAEHLLMRLESEQNL